MNHIIQEQDVPSINVDELARIFAIRGPRLTWLLGAGASASAGVPTAGQMIDDFKTILYATIHKVPIASVNLGDSGIRTRVQLFFDTHPDLPSLGQPDEYSLLFEAAWPSAKDRRAYIDSQISKGRPAYANMALAALVASNRIQIIWTTNFDRVVEDSVTATTASSSHLTVAALETSELARQAISQGRFPLLVKLHGDYQSEHLKNTRSELQTQDAAHRVALVEACASKGLLVCGYSGRDQSLMDALNEVLDGKNAFPDGLYWARRHGERLEGAEQLLDRARRRGVDARFIDVETFDELVSSLLQAVSLPAHLQDRLQKLRERPDRQPFVLPSQHGDWPAMWINAIKVNSFPTTCRQVTCDIGGTGEVRRAFSNFRALGARRRMGVICFGADSEIRGAMDLHGISSWGIGTITKESLSRTRSSELGLLYDALTRALARVRPLVVVRRGHAHCLVVDPDRADDITLDPLRAALRTQVQQRPNTPGGVRLTGQIPGTNLEWREGIELHLSVNFNELWLVFEPFVWAERDVNGASPLRKDFIDRRRWHRYNRTASDLFNAWAKILGTGTPPVLFGIPDAEGIDACFELNSRLAVARAGASLR